jgi:hypothetical protein
MLGYSRTGSFPNARMPISTITIDATRQMTGRLMEMSDKII